MVAIFLYHDHNIEEISMVVIFLYHDHDIEDISMVSIFLCFAASMLELFRL